MYASLLDMHAHEEKKLLVIQNILACNMSSSLGLTCYMSSSLAPFFTCASRKLSQCMNNPNKFIWFRGQYELFYVLE